MVITNKNPFHYPSFSLKNRIARAIWDTVYCILFRPSLRSMHGWRRFLLKLFGAKLGTRCNFYPTCRVWAPWNLDCGSFIGVGNGAEIYNPKKIVIKDYATISQYAYLCGASHDVDNYEFPLIAEEITIGQKAWICAHAKVLQGVKVGEGAVLGLGSIATNDLESWTIYAGIPAKKVRLRKKHI